MSKAKKGFKNLVDFCSYLYVKRKFLSLTLVSHHHHQFKAHPYGVTCDCVFKDISCAIYCVLFIWCDGYECDLLCIYILELHIAIAQNRYETHSICDIAHISATEILHSQHVKYNRHPQNPFFKSQSHSQKSHRVNEPLVPLKYM